VLTKTDYEDFGREVFPAAFRSGHVQIHMFDGYWEDIGTIRSFFEANLALAAPVPQFDLSVAEAPIYTSTRFLPSSKIEGATINNSLVADGCRIGKGTVIENSIVGLRTIIGHNVTIRNSIIMGADYYETQADLSDDANEGAPCMGIGEGAVIEGAIIDKNCHIGRGANVVNSSGVEKTADADDCMIVEGIPIALKNAILPDGWDTSGLTVEN